MSVAGLNLILAFEVGGEPSYAHWPHPEFEHDQESGVTWGIGYDGHQNSSTVILEDWSQLGTGAAMRLARTHPYYGPMAEGPARDVADVTVAWGTAIDIFQRVDMARTEQQCRRAFPHFDRLRLGAKDALRSLVFNRGASMIGDSRREMRALRSLIAEPHLDYDAMAEQFRLMIRIWRGTPIYEGMRRRRLAEAALMSAPGPEAMAEN